MRRIIGFSQGDSILAPGGSISNMYGLLCARHKFFPEFKSKGLLNTPIAVYTSAQVRAYKRLCYLYYSKCILSATIQSKELAPPLALEQTIAFLLSATKSKCLRTAVGSLILHCHDWILFSLAEDECVPRS